MEPDNFMILTTCKFLEDPILDITVLNVNTDATVIVVKLSTRPYVR